ncbi:MAG: hypothetical protein RIE58_05855 [Vicingaceae bacterium]
MESPTTDGGVRLFYFSLQFKWDGIHSRFSPASNKLEWAQKVVSYKINEAASSAGLSFLFLTSVEMGRDSFSLFSCVEQARMGPKGGPGQSYGKPHHRWWCQAFLFLTSHSSKLGACSK